MKKENKMKTNLLILLIALISFSCVQEEDVFRADLVKYEVQCGYCIVYFVDDTQREKHFVVNGNWQYEFATTRMDSVYLRMGKSALIDALPLYASIKQGGKVIAEYDGELGWDEVVIEGRLR